MLTPSFDLSQNDEFIIITIQIPYAKISEIEVFFQDTDFTFYMKPYYLRLNLPGNVLYSEKPYVNYDVDKKILTLKAEKAIKGQEFEGLDLTTKLLAPKKNKVATSPTIEVIDGIDTLQDDEELDWSLEQTPCEDLTSISIHGDQCGFANLYSYAVFNLKEETRELFDVEEPQSKTLSLRKEERLKRECSNFDEEHYLANLYEDRKNIKALLEYCPEWDILYDKLQSDSSIKSPDDLIQFTPEEKERLRKLTNKEYILDKNQVKVAFLSLIDIIFAYAYNKRTTEGDNTVESGWTINKLSATLSWLESFSSVSEVAVTCIRRSLCYPLFRHFELSVTILEDVRKIFLLGRKYILKCLLEIHEMFCLSEPRYILNDLYITDYCIWMQTKRCSSNRLVPIANTLGKVLLTKGDIGFNLVDVESIAEIAWMAYNPSAEELSCTVSKDKYATANDKEAKSNSSEDICTNLEKMSLQNETENLEGCCSNNTENLNSAYNDIFSEYESCSSCTSGSSCSSSYTYESDSDDSLSYDDSSSSDSDEDSESSSDDGAHRHLLKKENGEKLR